VIAFLKSGFEQMGGVCSCCFLSVSPHWKDRVGGGVDEQKAPVMPRPSNTKCCFLSYRGWTRAGFSPHTSARRGEKRLVSVLMCGEEWLFEPVNFNLRDMLPLIKENTKQLLPECGTRKERRKETGSTNKREAASFPCCVGTQNNGGNVDGVVAGWAVSGYLRFHFICWNELVNERMEE